MMRGWHGFGRGYGRGYGDESFGRFGGGRPGGGGGRGGRRLFDQGDLRLVVLSLIGEAPRHGYELIREIESRTGGLYAPSPGVIYPTLTLLEEMGLVAQGDAEGSKKLYTVTEAGQDELAKNAEAVAQLSKRMEATGAGRPDNAPVFRAMQNLKMAVQGRLMRPGTEQDVMLAAAAAIDEAAAKIERL